MTERSLVNGIRRINARTTRSTELTRRTTREDDGLTRRGRVFFRQTLTFSVEDVSRDATARTIIRLEDTIATNAITASRTFNRCSRLTTATAASLSEVGIVETSIALEASVDGTTSSAVVVATRRTGSRSRRASGTVVTDGAFVTLVNFDVSGVASVGASQTDVTSRARFAPERVGRPESSRARNTRSPEGVHDDGRGPERARAC